MASYKKLDSKCNYLVYKSSSSEDNVAAAILLTHSPLPQPRSLGFSLHMRAGGSGGGGWPSREGKSPGN